MLYCAYCNVGQQNISKIEQEFCKAMSRLLCRIDNHANSLSENFVFNDSASNKDLSPLLFLGSDEEQNFNLKIGSIFQCLRKEAGLSIKALSHHSKIDEITLREIERGFTPVSYYQIFNICHALNIQPFELVILLTPNFYSDCPQKGRKIYDILKLLRTSSVEVLDGTQLLLSLPQKSAQ